MFADNFFADLANGLFTSLFDAVIAIFLAPLSALASIIFTQLGGS